MPTLGLALLLALLGAGMVDAQTCAGVAHAPAFAGSEREAQLRSAQLTRGAAMQPLTVRQIGPVQLSELRVDSANIFVRHANRLARAGCAGPLRFSIMDPEAQLIHNTSFPLGWNDGVVWAGRGVTAVAHGGVAAAIGPLTMVLAPLAFVSQNAGFALAPNGLSGARRFADANNPGLIDLPQRFGDGRYGRLDPGNSSIRLDLPYVAVGLSTSSQFFGPAYDHPVILGNNAGGFPHLFAGSASPWRIPRLGTVHGRIFWGRLSESPHSVLADSGWSRLGSGIAGVFQPAILPELEVGFSRFFHVLQRDFRLDTDEILRPFGAIFSLARQRQSGAVGGVEPDNQLSSVFARLVLPNSGAEVYGEFGREDRNFDARELFYFGDHDAAYMVGLRKIFLRGRSAISVRGEVLNSRVTHLALSSSQAPWYVHTTVRQGHTHRGQALGSAAAYGGGASVLSVERHDDRGRQRLQWHRMQFAHTREPAPDLFRSDVAHLFEASHLRFGRLTDVELSLGAVIELNRQLADDAFGMRAQVTVRPGQEP